MKVVNLLPVDVKCRYVFGVYYRWHWLHINGSYVLLVAQKWTDGFDLQKVFCEVNSAAM